MVLQFWISVDGYSCAPDTGLWQVLEEIDDRQQQEEYVVGRLRQAGTHIMGRTTYEDMAQTWPSSDEPVAGPMNDIPKVVFSSTLPSADWPQTRIARGDISSELARLRAEPGGEILAHGGTRFMHSLIRSGLADECRLWVLPAAAGTGAPLFPALDHPLRLHLVGSTAFPSGLLELVYAPAGGNVSPA